MINKKKLIEELINNIDGCTIKDLIDIIQNFPEDPEQVIDFDALWDEYEQKYSCKKTASCDNCTYPNKLYNTTICFVDFLKSKHISTPRPKQFPVKKVWTLKEEYEDFCTEFLLQTVKTVMSVDPVGASKKYYDLTEKPDFSQVKVGDVVEIDHSLSNKPNYGIVQKNSNNILSIICNMHSINAFYISYSQIKSLTILKAAE